VTDFDGRKADHEHGRDRDEKGDGVDQAMPPIWIDTTSAPATVGARISDAA